MKRNDIHPSHEMELEYGDYGSDRHDMHTCKTCRLTTCFMCRTGETLDDDELAKPCLGFPYYQAALDGDRVIGRRSGTGWPKPPKKTT